MISTTRLHLAISILPLGVLGCPDSAGIPTGSFRADFDVTVTQEDARVNASLYDGDDSFSVELVDGDRLVATADGGEPITLDGAPYYNGEVPLGASEVKVELLRDGGDNAFMVEQVPEPVMLDATTISLADDPITITWSNPIDGGLVAIFVDTCAEVSIETPESKDPVDDSGSYSLTRAEIEAEADNDCAILVIGRRRFNNGEGGGFYSTSVMRAVRFERQQVTLTP